MPAHPTRRAGPLAASLVVSLVLALAGCGGGGGGGLDDVTVTGSGASSKVTVDAPLDVGSTTRTVLHAGSGRAATTGDAVVARFLAVNGRTGKVFGSDMATTTNPVTFVLGPTVIKGFTKALHGVKAGSRVLTAVSPADGYGPQGGYPQAKIKKTDSLVYLIDLLAVAPARATGAAQPAPAGLPAVTLAADGQPSIAAAAGAPPSALVSATLLRGSGPAVKDGQHVAVQYSGVVWGKTEPFDASWKTGTPFVFAVGAGQVITGWDKGVVGATVGSQLLLVVPPGDGYGPVGGQPSVGISATDTLVFVVDVLAATD